MFMIFRLLTYVNGEEENNPEHENDLEAIRGRGLASRGLIGGHFCKLALSWYKNLNFSLKKGSAAPICGKEVSADISNSLVKTFWP